MIPAFSPGPVFTMLALIKSITQNVSAIDTPYKKSPNNRR